MGIKSEQKGTKINLYSQTIKVKSEVKGNRQWERCTKRES